jgi:transcriptional regulator with XRE-family HTH domain
MDYNTYITTERTDIMLQENLIMLRSLAGKTQEDIAEVIGISRQAYAKWERGETIPDIEKCGRLAEFYGVTMDSLIKDDVQLFLYAHVSSFTSHYVTINSCVINTITTR